METQLNSQNQNFQGSDDETQIRTLLDQFIAAIRSANLEEIMSFYAPDVVAFDIMPPARYVGKEEYRKAWSNIQAIQAPLTYEFTDLNLEVSGDIAFGYCMTHMGGKTKDDEEINMWTRYTVCLKRITGNWLIVHENYSVPIDMKTEKAIFNLQA